MGAYRSLPPFPPGYQLAQSGVPRIFYRMLKPCHNCDKGSCPLCPEHLQNLVIKGWCAYGYMKGSEMTGGAFILQTRFKLQGDPYCFAKEQERRIPTIYDITNPRLAELANAIPFRDWLQVLARPNLFQMLTRQPSREHLLMLCDAYLPYARSRRELAKEQGYVSHAENELLATELAERMHALLENWSAHSLTLEAVGTASLTPEIVDTARALLVADGSHEVVDLNFVPELDPGQTIDDLLIWPSSQWRPT